MVTVRNGTARSSANRKANGKEDRAKNTATATKTKARSTNSDSNGNKQQLDADGLARKIINGVNKVYKVELAERSDRLLRKVAYALREKLGKDIQAQVEKNKRNGVSKQSFDWKQWNNEIFPKLVGDPEQMNYSAEILASVAASIYDTVPSDISGAIDSLVEYNLQSLQARNNLNNKNEVDLDSLDDDEDIDNFFDDEDDDDLEIEDIDDDDDDDEDDDDFELDE
jgi:hypothetical protein